MTPDEGMLNAEITRLTSSPYSDVADLQSVYAFKYLWPKIWASLRPLLAEQAPGNEFELNGANSL